MRGFLSGLTLLLVGVMIGVLVGPQVRGSAAAYRIDRAQAVGGSVAGVASTTPPSASQSAAAAALRAVLTGQVGTPATAPAGASPAAEPLAEPPAPTATTSAVASPSPASDLPLPPPVDVLPVVVGLGDSITYNPGSWFRRVCTEAVVLRNCVDAGVRGNTTAQMLARMDADALSYRPSVVIVMGGTNDVRHEVPTKVVLRRLVLILNRARSTGAAVVLSTIPPCDRFGPQVLALNGTIRDYAARNRVPLLDLYAATGQTDGTYQPGLSRDGIHPRTAGAVRMAALATEQLPALVGNRLPPVGGSPVPGLDEPSASGQVAHPYTPSAATTPGPTLTP